MYLNAVHGGDKPVSIICTAYPGALNINPILMIKQTRYEM